MPIDLKLVNQELKRFNRDPKKYKINKINKLETIISPKTDSLTFKAISLGETDNYATYVQFFDMNFKDEPTQRDTERTVIDGIIKHYAKPSVRFNPVKLYCQCADFRFRFEKELYDNAGLIGNWRKYIRQTPLPPIGHPYVNPKHFTGYCKHIWSLLVALRYDDRIEF